MERADGGKVLQPLGWPSGWVTFRGIMCARTWWRPARGTVSSDSSWKAGGREIRLGRRLLRTGAGSPAGLGLRPAALLGGWDRQEAKWLLF